MNTHDAQNAVAQAVRDRGYWDGWTPAQVLVRQMAKMAEELAEAAQCVELPRGALRGYIMMIGALGRYAFDRSDIWAECSVGHSASLASELADMQVVLLNAAAALEAHTGQPFDVVQAAVEKATADVKRGRRGA